MRQATIEDILEFATELGVTALERVEPSEKYKNSVVNWLHDLGHLVLEMPLEYVNNKYPLFNKPSYYCKFLFVCDQLQKSSEFNALPDRLKNKISLLTYNCLLDEWDVGVWQNLVAEIKGWNNCLGVRNLYGGRHTYIDAFTNRNDVYKSQNTILSRFKINVKKQIYLPKMDSIDFVNNQVKIKYEGKTIININPKLDNYCRALFQKLKNSNKINLR